MNEKEFTEAVLAMRKAQKNFFATRNANYLQTAKKYEKLVDEYLFPKPPDTQGKMF